MVVVACGELSLYLVWFCVCFSWLTLTVEFYEGWKKKHNHRHHHQQVEVVWKRAKELIAGPMPAELIEIRLNVHGALHLPHWLAVTSTSMCLCVCLCVSVNERERATPTSNKQQVLVNGLKFWRFSRFSSLVQDPRGVRRTMKSWVRESFLGAEREGSMVWQQE